jgi:hypothetical protein
MPRMATSGDASAEVHNAAVADPARLPPAASLFVTPLAGGDLQLHGTCRCHRHLPPRRGRWVGERVMAHKVQVTDDLACCMCE